VTPTSRTLKLLKGEGKIAEVSERWNSFTKQRKDLFGFIDIICLDISAKQTWGIQCTSTGNMSARIKKICTECKEQAIAWLQAGNYIEVIGWSKKGPRNKRKTWQCSRRNITLVDINEFGV
jgi:hypothetical protein